MSVHNVNPNAPNDNTNIAASSGTAITICGTALVCPRSGNQAASLAIDRRALLAIDTTCNYLQLLKLSPNIFYYTTHKLLSIHLNNLFTFEVGSPFNLKSRKP